MSRVGIHNLTTRILTPLILATLTVVGAPTVAHAATPTSLPEAFDYPYTGSNLTLTKTLATTNAYTRHAITYEANGLTISGVLNRPRGKGPFPVVVLAHGYIDPKVYVTGQGFRREQDWLARNGYVALHVDYRNHAKSDKDPRNDGSLRLGYAADVIGAALAVQESDLPFIDNNNIALLGRSMGGGVAYQALSIAPGLFDAGITYASVSSKAEDNFNRWQRNDYDIAKEVLANYGEPKKNPRAWQELSSRYYFSRVTEPILAFHGTADDTCDISWARATQNALQRAGVDARLVEYKGAGHYFYGPWNDSIKKVGAFLKKHLTDTPT